jgi:hypothetical protein
LTNVLEKWDATTVSGSDQMPRHAARQTSSVTAGNVITITGTGDHDQPDWLITFTGMRIGIGRQAEK